MGRDYTMLNILELNYMYTYELILIGDDGTRNSLKSSVHVSPLRNNMEATESVKNLRVILDADNAKTCD